MEYIDARCNTCGTWRTALVGYGGAKVCLTCGGTIDQGSAASSLTRFSAGSLLDLLWTPGRELSQPERRERLRGWLSGQSISLPDSYIEVLAHCESAAQVRFALPVVTLSTWYPIGEKSFSDGNWTLRLQHPVLGHRVDFVLEGPGASRALVIEIDAVREREGEQRRKEHQRTLDLQAARYRVLRIPSEKAEERGANLRHAFMREALEVIENSPPAASAEAAAGKPVVKTRRLWSRHELVYDASSVPFAERRELVEDWLLSRGEQLQGWQLDFLAHCDRAAEIHFALPFLRLPNAEPVDDRTVHLDPWHTLTAQVLIDRYPVDFSFVTALQQGREVVTTLVEIYPARGARDRPAEARRLREWKRDGHTVIDIPAAEAASRGRHWAQSLLGELRGRNVRDAS